MKRLVLIVVIGVCAFLTGAAQAPVFPSHQFLTGKVKAVSYSQIATEHYFYDEMGHLVQYDNKNGTLFFVWTGDEIKTYCGDKDSPDPSYQYAYIDESSAERFSYYSGIYRFITTVDKKGRIESQIKQSVIEGGYVITQSQSYYYDGENISHPSKYITSNGQTFIFTSLEQDSVGNSTKYSILYPDGHTDVYERTIEYY